MILEVPTSEDFKNHGIDYLNIGWGTVLDILISLEDAEDCLSEEGIKEISSDFWVAAERELGTALSLIEQGAEFLIKSRICEVSPWLLLTRNPVDWPRGCSSQNVNFAHFRTIDAQDLIKVHDTFSERRFDEEFGRVFDLLRQQRNSIIHTVDKSMKITASELIERLLIVSEHLLGSRTWLRHRLDFLERDRHTELYQEGGNDYRVAREFVAVVGALKPAELRRFFDYNKKQRAYRCPSCTNLDWSYDGKTAQLTPNSPRSTTLHCYACGQDFTVERTACVESECKGNVFDPGYGRCLTCWNEE